MILAIALLAGTATYQQANAQIKVSFNIGVQPIWGPTGYDYAQYYYMPELGVYYDIQNRMYYYQDGRNWTGVATLPPRYSRYNLYNTYKVVLNERTPWMRDQAIRRQYANYRNRHDQGAIRDSRDTKYWESAGHPHHKDWEMQHNNGRGNGRDDRNNRNDRPNPGVRHEDDRNNRQYHK